MTLSKLRNLEDKIIHINDLEQSKKDLVDAIRQCDLPSKDCMKMCMNIATCTSVTQLQQLFYNCLLKYEGLGVI